MGRALSARAAGRLRRMACACLLLLPILLAPDAAAAEDPAFSGRLVDGRTGAPLAGASVSVAGAAGTVRTDPEGRFRLSPPPALPFHVIVVLPGGSVAGPILVDRTSRGGLDIPVVPLTDEALTVVGAAPSIIAAPASATTLLPALQIARRAPQNLVQALESVPGVGRVSEGHAAVPSIRGLARGRTLILIDGARVSSERRVGPGAAFADPAAFEGVDVARGPGSVAYGSDALGGVISIRTVRPAPGTPLLLRGSVTAAAGTPGTRTSAQLSRGLARGGVLVHAHARQAGDWSAPRGGGRVFNSGWRDRGALVRFDHELGPGLFSAGLQSDFARDIERPRSNSREVRFSYPFETSHRVTTAYEIPELGGVQQVRLGGFFGTLAQRAEQDRAPAAAGGRALEQSDLSVRDYQVRGAGARLLGRTRVGFGVDVNGRFGLHATERRVEFGPTGSAVRDIEAVAIGSARRDDLGAYVEAETAVHRLVHLAAGLRGDRVSARNDGGHFGRHKATHAALSGFLASTVRPVASVSVVAQVSRGFRDPTLSDRYYRGPTGRGFVEGSPGLSPERSVQLDLAIRYTRSRAQLAVYAYRYEISDLVERYATAPDVFYFRNRGRARLHGVEVEGRAEVGAGLSIEAGAAGGSGIAAGEDAFLDDVPAPGVFVLLRREFPRRAYAKIRGTFTAADRRPGPTEIVTPPARSLDVSAGYPLSPRLELRGVVRNLLDDRFYASPDPRWVYAPGRAASVTLAVQLGKP